jgi:transcriptional regulator with XRE-family HTH domain
VGRSEQPVPDGPLKEFAEGLRALRRNERLTYRQLSQRARYSYSVLSTAASGNTLPTLEVTLAYVGACNGDAEEWEERWNTVAAILRAADEGSPSADERRSATAIDTLAPCRPTSIADDDWSASIEPPGEDGPRRIGAYRILGQLGAGATGDVYLAGGPSGRASAVKVIRPQFARDPIFCRRFAREIAAARKVRGGYTATVIDADAHAKQPWMASEYLPGPSLAEVVEKHGPLPCPVVLALAVGISEALSAFHAAGVVHRDLKPTNVLLTRDGPRVIDFGIAHCLEDTALTATGALVGTAGFMAPEQAEGRQVTPAVDVFALGCVLAYAATGRAPFGDGASPSVLYRIVHDDPAEEALTCDNTALRELITHCLVKDPDKRPTPAQIIDACAASVQIGPGWLPEPVAARAARMEAAATDLIKRAARRRAVRRVQGVSAVLLSVLALAAAMAAFDSGGTRRVLGEPRGIGAPMSAVAAPEPAATSTFAGNRIVSRAAQRIDGDATQTVVPVTQVVGQRGPSSAAGASPTGLGTSTREFYSFEHSTDGWRPIAGGVRPVSSSAFHYDGQYSLGLTDISEDGDAGCILKVAVADLPNGPTAGATITAWVYVPVEVAQGIEAELYVMDDAGAEHEPADVKIPPGIWYQLTYTAGGYNGNAQAVGLKVSDGGAMGATIYLDAVSWD